MGRTAADGGGFAETIVGDLAEARASGCARATGGVCFGGAVATGGGAARCVAAVDGVADGTDAAGAGAEVFGADAAGAPDFGLAVGSDVDAAGGDPGAIGAGLGAAGVVVFGDVDGGTFDRDGDAGDRFPAVVVTGAGRCACADGASAVHHVHA